jgi:hypothetical protein
MRRRETTFNTWKDCQSRTITPRIDQQSELRIALHARQEKQRRYQRVQDVWSDRNWRVEFRREFWRQRRAGGTKRFGSTKQGPRMRPSGTSTSGTIRLPDDEHFLARQLPVITQERLRYLVQIVQRQGSPRLTYHNLVTLVNDIMGCSRRGLLQRLSESALVNLDLKMQPQQNGALTPMFNSHDSRVRGSTGFSLLEGDLSSLRRKCGAGCQPAADC